MTMREAIRALAIEVHGLRAEMLDARRDRQEIKDHITRITTAVVGIPGSEEKGLVGDFKTHAKEDAEFHTAITERVGNLESFKRNMLAFCGLIGLTSGSGGTVLAKWLPTWLSGGQ